MVERSDGLDGNIRLESDFDKKSDQDSNGFRQENESTIASQLGDRPNGITEDLNTLEEPVSDTIVSALVIPHLAFWCEN